MKMASCHPERKHKAKGLCSNCYTKKRYIDHPEKHKASCQMWNKKNLGYSKVLCQRGRRVVLEAKKNPCTDCGGIFHFSIMDFDHVQGPKRFNISDAGARSVEMILAEIAKCELVCANCHRFRTWKRVNNVNP